MGVGNFMNPLRIGIDARFLSHPQRGGFKTYTNNLLLAMSEIDDVNKYFVYLDRPLKDGFFPQKGNWHYRVVSGSFPLFGMPLREQILMRQQVVDDQIDVVHFLCNTATVNLNKKYVVTLHDTIQVTETNRFNLLGSLSTHRQRAITAYSKWVINNSAPFATRIITVSNYERERISHQLNISPERIEAIHLAPNPIFHPATASEKSVWRSKLTDMFGIRKKYILGMGYEPRKNIEFLIETYSKLAFEHEYLELVIVCAEQTRRTYFEKLTETFGLTGKVLILGSLPAEYLVILYNMAEAFFYPSERESFGLPPLEAISCGVPTIAMKATSIPEILEGGALLLDGKDHQDWVYAFRKLMADEEFKSQLIHRGLEQASKFTWHRCAQETVQVYFEAAKASGCI